MNDKDHTLPPIGRAGNEPVTVVQSQPPHSLLQNPHAPGSAPVLEGRYQLGEELARGGMGVVYRARDTAFNRDVAIKLLHSRLCNDPVDITRFLAEARITGQLQHPGIPPVFEVGQLPDGTPYLAMKLIKGQTLADLLASGRCEPPGSSTLPGDSRPPLTKNLLPVFEQIAQAVGYAHAHKVIHRDLKPANVMVGAFGEVQVMDWGLAKVLTESPPTVRTPASHDETRQVTEIRSAREQDDATQAGCAMGTPAYMPREQAIGAIDQIDEQSDVFGLGGILCVILTGIPPYPAPDGETARQMAAIARLDATYSRLDACGAEPGLIALCKRCLSAEKAERPRNAGEVADAVAALRAAADERARHAEIARAQAEIQIAEQHKRRKVQLALGGALLLLVCAGGTFAWWQDRQATQRDRASERSRDAIAASLERCEQALRENDTHMAQLAWEEVEKRSLEGGTNAFRERIQRCRTNLTLLEELDRIDTFRWTPVENKLPPNSAVVARWEAAFKGFGIEPGATAPIDAARLLTESLIRDRLLTALDLWLVLGDTPALVPLLAAADPDPFREAVRMATRTGSVLQVRSLAVLAVSALEQPPRFVVALGENRALPATLRRGLLERAMFLRPGDLSTLMGLSGTYPLYQFEGAAERVRWLQAAVAAHPRNVAALNNLGNALRDKGDGKGAIAAYREALRIDPTFASAHSNLGVALRLAGNLEGAIAAFRDAIRHDPSYPNAHYNLGIALKEQGKLEAAIAEYREAIRHDPRHFNAHYNLGNALFDKDDLDGAIPEYREAIKLFPQHPLPHFNLGLVLHQKGLIDEAAAEFRETIKSHPTYAEAHNSLGVVLREMRDFDAAIAAHQEAIKLEPTNPRYVQALHTTQTAQAAFTGRLAPWPREKGNR